MSGKHRKIQPIFVVTVDTEADDAWNAPQTVKLDNIRQLPRFQELCDKYDVIPTYLVTYECAARDEAIRYLEPLSKLSRCEIGHHLHVWTTPPFQNRSACDVDTDWLQAFQFELPTSLFEEKAESLRAKIEEVYGRSPTSHRAGRWGIDQRTIDWLCQSGFRVDTSVRPLAYVPSIPMPECSYHDEENPFMWDASEEFPSRWLWEVPVTIHRPAVWLANLYRRCIGRKSTMHDTLRRIYVKLGGLLPLRPDPRVSPQSMRGIIDAAFARKVQVINFTLHSSELELGCSPFSQNYIQANAVWERLELVFAHINAYEISPRALSDVPNSL